MNCPDYNSPQALKKILDEKGFAMQKKFGQNFLTSPDAREKIVSLLSLASGEDIWEVGPGLGAMTSGLLTGGARVTAFELDRGFISLLECYFNEERNDGTFRIVAGDVFLLSSVKLQTGCGLCLAARTTHPFQSCANGCMT